MAAIGLVHASEARFHPAEARDETTKRTELRKAGKAAMPALGDLPPQVIEMRDGILAAATLGDIDELRTPLEWNELPPDIADGPVDDPIAHWKSLSADGEGAEILAALSDILALPPAVERGGRDIENNRLFVWPYLAERQLDKLTPAEVVDLYRLVPPAEARAMKQTGRYTWWRLVIGADGTWHTFKRGD